MRAKRGSLPLLVLTLLLSGVVEAQRAKPLLVPTTRQGSLKLKPDATVIRQRRVEVDLGPLKSSDNQRLELPLFDGDKVVLVRDETESDPSGVLVWEGEVEGQPGSEAILATAKNILVGDVMTRDRKGTFGFYQIRYLGNGVHVLKEVDQSKFPEEERVVEGRPRKKAFRARDPKEASGFFTARYSESSAPPAVLVPTPGPNSELCDPASRIDALVVYTDAARDAVGGKDAMRLLIKSAERSTNRSYRLSGVTQRLRVVHVQRVNYAASGGTETHRRRLQDTSDGHLDDVLPLRDAHGADVVVLILGATSPCGWSKTMEDKTSRENEKEAYAAVRHDCIGSPTWSFAHELGHIMGARHNRQDDETEGKPFAFNHGFVLESPSTGSPWHTIMAKELEACDDPPRKCSNRIPRWSNPKVSYPDESGDPTGNADNDNHQALEETALTVANFRCATR